MTTIDRASFAAFAPKAPPEAADALNDAAGRFGIVGRLPIVHWLGQGYHESNGFTCLVENLNYSAARLRQVWPKRFAPIAGMPRAEAYANNPEALANLVYGGRGGNTLPGDGWKFRGGGAFQLTFHDNYEAAQKGTGLPLLDDPDLARHWPGAAMTAGWFWQSKGLTPLALRDDGQAITLKVNGGLNGLAERLAAVARAKAIWKV